MFKYGAPSEVFWPVLCQFWPITLNTSYIILAWLVFFLEKFSFSLTIVLQTLLFGDKCGCHCSWILLHKLQKPPKQMHNLHSWFYRASEVFRLMKVLPTCAGVPMNMTVSGASFGLAEDSVQANAALYMAKQSTNVTLFHVQHVR